MCECCRALEVSFSAWVECLHALGSHALRFLSCSSRSLFRDGDVIP
jgi:hypothetical protein